jgi:hypothetical protein
VTVNAVFTTGVEGFVAALEEFAADPVVESGLVTYTVMPVSGALAGRRVRTGVTLEEVAPWPTAPPHWIHVAAEVRLPVTNVGGSPNAGWAAHSRDIAGWGTAREPIVAWLAHLRGVLGDAV